MTRKFIGVLGACAIITAGICIDKAPAQTDILPPPGYDSSGPHGLWRDIDGNPWCGGPCGAGQRCCWIQS